MTPRSSTDSTIMDWGFVMPKSANTIVERPGDRHHAALQPRLERDLHRPRDAVERQVAGRRSTSTVAPSAGTDPRSTGAVSVNDASGNWPVSSAWRRSWPSRRCSSLWSVVRSAVNAAAVIVVPSTVIVPRHVRRPADRLGRADAGERLLDAVARRTTRRSRVNEPTDGSTVQVPRDARRLRPDPAAADPADGLARVRATPAPGPAGPEEQVPDPDAAGEDQDATQRRRRDGAPGRTGRWVVTAALLLARVGTARGEPAKLAPAQPSRP